MSVPEVGDYLVYPCQGVGQVMSIEKRTVDGRPTSFVLLKVMDTHADVLIPAERVTDCGVRPPIDAARAENILSVFDEPVTTPKGSSWIQRNRVYQSHLSNGSPNRVAVVLRDLFHMKLTGRLTFGQLQTFERSYRTTVYELAIALNTTPSLIETTILERLKRANGLLDTAA